MIVGDEKKKSGRTRSKWKWNMVDQDGLRNSSIFIEEDGSSSNNSQISTHQMMAFVESLKTKYNRDSTMDNYVTVWQLFNRFLIKLGERLRDWEDRAALFCGFLIHQERKATMIRSYMSAIKAILKLDNYKWNDDRVVLGSLIRAGRIRNDTVKTKFPIHWKLLEQLIFEVGRIFSEQPYLGQLYKTILAIGYYGLFRVGELTEGDHVIWATNVHLGTNKNKILIVLFTSKTHGKDANPQKVQIHGSYNAGKKNGLMHFCPFQLMRQYIAFRERIVDENEQFFIFRDGSPVKPYHLQKVLANSFRNLGINHKLYTVHSLRIGRSSDLLKQGYSVDQIKLMGRWKSNVVFCYIRNYC